MTNAEKFNLKKSYNPDLTIIGEIKNVKDGITRHFQYYQSNSSIMSKIEVDRWYDAMIQMRSYLDYLKSKV